jgi:hypothetical protein
MTMKAGLSHARTNPMQAKLMLAGSCKQLKVTSASLQWSHIQLTKLYYQLNSR